MAIDRSSDTDGAAAQAPPFDDVYLQHRRRVFAICLNSLGNADDAEDATQETFVKAAPHLVHFEGNVAAYLSVVARNVCCDEVRRRTLQRRAAGELGRRGGREEIESRAVDRSVLTRLLPRLTRGERELLLHSFAGYSYDEIADRMGSPVGTVRVRLARARKRARGLAGGMAGVLLVPAWRLLRRGAQRAAQAPGAVSAAADQAALVSAGVVTSLLAAAAAGGLGTAGARALPTGTGVTAAQVPSTESRAAGVAGAPPVAAAPGGGTGAAGGQRSGTSGGARTASGGSRPITNLVPQGSEVSSDQMWVDGTSASPGSSSQPGPIFAWGHTGASCNGACELLYRSDDSGRTWQHLAANGFASGQVLVPPTFPANPTLFAMTASKGLLVSPDAGASWKPAVVSSGATALPGATAAAVMPVAPVGHPVVAFDTGSRSVETLDATDGSTTLYTLPVGVEQVVSLAYAGSLLLASATDAQSFPLVLVCATFTAGSQCKRTGPAWSGNEVDLLPVAGDPGIVAVLDNPGTLYTTRDGASFTEVAATGLSGSVDARSARLLGGAVVVALQAVDQGMVRAELLSAQAAQPLAALPDNQASTLLLLPGDAVLAGGRDLDGSSQPGLRCSHDTGGHWAGAC